MDRLAQRVFADDGPFKRNYENVYDDLAKHAATSPLPAVWALLAKLLERCDDEMFRKLQKKVQKRIVQASKLEADVGMLQFVRIAMQKNPSYRMHNKQALYTVAMTGLDYALTSVGSDAIFHLSVELYCRVTDFAEESERLLRTVSAIARQQSPPFEGQERLLPLQSLYKIGASIDAPYVVGFLWRVYAAGFEYVDQGFATNLETFIDSLEDTFMTGDSHSTNCAAVALATVVRCADATTLIHARRIVQLLTHCPLPKATQYHSLRYLNDTFLTSSTVHTHFPALLQRFVNEVDTSTDSLAELLASIIRTSACSINTSQLCQLQEVVCRRALAWMPRKSTLGLLNALLECNHEGVPPPVQVAQCVFWRHFKDVDPSLQSLIESGRNLCAVYLRPRIQPLPVAITRSSGDNISNREEVSDVHSVVTHDRAQDRSATEHMDTQNGMHDETATFEEIDAKSAETERQRPHEAASRARTVVVSESEDDVILIDDDDSMAASANNGAIQLGPNGSHQAPPISKKRNKRRKRKRASSATEPAKVLVQEASVPEAPAASIQGTPNAPQFAPAASDGPTVEEMLLDFNP